MASASIIVHRLGASQREDLHAHLLALDADDLRLRFGTVMGPESIRRYVEAIDFGSDVVFAVLGERLEVLGAAHIGFTRGSAELGVSVAPEHRAKGIGQALVERAEAHVRNRFVDRLFMHCLAENTAMMRIARRAGMEIVVAYGEAEAFVRLEAPTPGSVADEFIRQRTALFDYDLKARLSMLHAASAAATAALHSARAANDPPTMEAAAATAGR
jgi:RimJ/RimL family protein N-acetyltransferase